MHDEDEPLLARVREIAMALPQVGERLSHGRPTFFCTKMFVMYGGSVKPTSGKGKHTQHPDALLFWPHPVEKHALEQDPRFFFPAYLGPWGWLGIDLDEDTDWVEIAELIETAYREVAPPEAIAELDARGVPPAETAQPGQ